MAQPELTQEQMFKICKIAGCSLTTIKDHVTGKPKEWIAHASGLTWTGRGWEVIENRANGVRTFVPASAIGMAPAN